MAIWNYVGMLLDVVIVCCVPAAWQQFPTADDTHCLPSVAALCVSTVSSCATFNTIVL